MGCARDEHENMMCGGGITACSICGLVADYLCDFPVGDGKTCDLPLCARHRHSQGEIGRLAGLDYCPQHDDLVRSAGGGGR